MGIWMNINVGVVVANVILLSGLLWMYGGMLRQVSTRFTWGLMAFASILWLQNVVQLYFYATMMQYFVTGVQPLVLVQNGLATAATLLLLWVTAVPVRRGAPA